MEEYAAMRAEHDDLAKRIRKLRRQADSLKDAQVADTVKGSREDLTFGPIKVVGKPTKLYHEKLRQIERAERRYRDLDLQLITKLGEVEDFLAAVTSAKVRTILRQRYIDGLTWGEIGRRRGKTPDWCRKMIERFFEEKD